MNDHPVEELATHDGCAVAVDIGGSTIKGAVVDLRTGTKLTKRLKVATPEVSTPHAVSRALEALVEVLHREHPQSAELPIGVTVPGTVRAGTVTFVGNLDQSWVGTDAQALLGEALGVPVAVINDADAAALGELAYGAARDAHGLVVVSTLGTGIGSGLLRDGVLVPNTELGQLELHGGAAERYAAAIVREREDLSWTVWASRLQEYYRMVEDLFWPDLIVVGGGVTKKADKFVPLLTLRTPVVVAELRNDAGILGAGLIGAGVMSPAGVAGDLPLRAEPLPVP